MSATLVRPDYAGPVADPAWQAELDRIAPRGDRTSWLRLVWVAGDAWEPVERWFVYQMIPRTMLSPDVEDLVGPSLDGPNPRQRGRWDGVLGRFVPDPACNVDRLQWLLYRETRCLAKPLYIVQGSRGGHPRRWSRAMSVLARIDRQSDSIDPPEPGALPYAEPDSRTWAGIREMETMTFVAKMAGFVRQNASQFDLEDEAIVTRMEERVREYMHAAVDEAEGAFGTGRA